MFGFTQKSRAASHRELLEKARNALDLLKVRVDMTWRKDGLPVWDMPDTIPLEYRRHVYDCVDVLVTALYHPGMQARVGVAADMARQQAELTWLQRYLSGNFTADQRTAFRAWAFEEMGERARRESDRLAKSIALNDFDALYQERNCRQTIDLAREALSWFPNQDALTRAKDLQRRLLRRDSPGLVLSDVKKPMGELETMLPRLIEYWAQTRAWAEARRKRSEPA